MHLIQKRHPDPLRYSQLLSFVTPHRRTLFVIVLLLLAGTVISLLTPLIAGKLTQTLLEGPSGSGYTAGSILLAWLVLMVFQAVIDHRRSFYIASTGIQMSANLRSRVYEHMQILPMAYFQERKRGDILSLLSSDAGSISQFVTGTLVQLLPQTLTLVLAFSIMAWLDSVVAVTAALLIPAYYVSMKLLGRKLRFLSSRWIESRSSLLAFVNENLGMMPVIKGFTREPLESARFDLYNRDLLEVSRQQISASTLLSPAIGLLAGAGSLLLLWLAIRHLEAGTLQPSELVSLLLYAMLMTRPLASLANVYGSIMITRGAAERLLEFFGQQPEPVNDSQEPLPAIGGRIEFNQISFAYPGRLPVLTDFDLLVEPGETVALTGPNGAGKTTLVHLLMRFIEPGKGTIKLDGIDIGTVEISSLRRQIGLVAQDTLLMNGTIAENICYAAPGASPEDMKKAARAAHAESFIEELPDGYETVIGDQGVRLSGGQRQRLSLARTLLKDPPVLVLDEATAMFDPEGEAGFIEESTELLQRKTVILITHRPASLALADRIVEM